MSWNQENNQITKEFNFKDFAKAMVFINEVARLAEMSNHHPDIFLHDYKKVKLTLSTHSEGRVTQRDYQLAEAIDKIKFE